MDNSTIFYIGIGTKKSRAYTDKARSNFWHNTVNKAGGYIVEILYEDISWEKACDHEKYLIAVLGRKDLGTGLLVNLTEGGEGIVGLKHNPNIGRLPWNVGIKWSQEQKEKLRATKIKNGNISSRCKGKKRSDETRLKNSQAASKFMWITNDIENKRVLKEVKIPLGWRHGRFKKRTKYENKQEAEQAQNKRACEWYHKNKNNK
jgi:hypothetical protein